jgi:hypothetical protein
LGRALSIPSEYNPETVQGGKLGQVICVWIRLAEPDRNCAAEPKHADQNRNPSGLRSYSTTMGAGAMPMNTPPLEQPLRISSGSQLSGWNAMRLRATFLGGQFLCSLGYYVDRIASGGLNRLQIVRPSIRIEEDFRPPLRSFG